MLQKKVIRTIHWLWERKFQTFPQSSQQSCHNGILRIQRMNSRKKKLEVYSSLIFSDTAQNFFDFMPRVFCRIINYAFYSPKEVFGRNFCLKSTFHVHGFQAILSAGLLHKILDRIVQSESKVSRSSYFRKKNLLECLSISFFLDCEL